jgi:Rod binding domain-containing protein
MDIHLPPAKTAAPNPRTPAAPSTNAVIPENETFRQAFKAASDKGDTPDKILGVSKQFEALMIGQMLKSAREASGGGWLGNEDGQDDQTGSLVMEMAEQAFSQAMAARGGLGIAKMVTAQLERSHAKTASSDSEAPRPSTHTGWKR